MLMSCDAGHKNFFRRITGGELPKDARLILVKHDDTERAYVWYCPKGVKGFEISENLPFERGYSEWRNPGFSYFGKLIEGDFSDSMQFKVFRNSAMRVAVGRDLKNNQIAISFMDTN